MSVFFPLGSSCSRLFWYPKWYRKNRKLSEPKRKILCGPKPNEPKRIYSMHRLYQLKPSVERSNDLQLLGHEAIATSPKSGVNTLTGEGLAEVLM